MAAFFSKKNVSSVFGAYSPFCLCAIALKHKNLPKKETMFLQRFCYDVFAVFSSLSSRKKVILIAHQRHQLYTKLVFDCLHICVVKSEVKKTEKNSSNICVFFFAFICFICVGCYRQKSVINTNKYHKQAKMKSNDKVKCVIISFSFFAGGTLILSHIEHTQNQ